MPRWGDADDAKLLALFRKPRGGLDPKKFSVDDVKAAHSKHWSNMNYNTFAARYRAKARSFCTTQTLNGHRKRSKAAKDANQQEAQEEELEDEDYKEEEEEDVDLEGFDSVSDGEVEEETMPKKQARAARRGDSKQVNGDPLAAVVKGMADLGVQEQEEAKPFSMSVKFPFIVLHLSQGEAQPCNG